MSVLPVGYMLGRCGLAAFEYDCTEEKHDDGCPVADLEVARAEIAALKADREAAFVGLEKLRDEIIWLQDRHLAVTAERDAAKAALVHEARFVADWISGWSSVNLPMELHNELCARLASNAARVAKLGTKGGT